MVCQTGCGEMMPAQLGLRVPGFFLALIVLFAVSSCPRLAAEEDLRAKEALERRQKVEWMSFFLKDPKDAEIPSTTIAIQLFNRGVEHYEKKEFKLALQALEDSLGYNLDNALAYELMGDIHYARQDMSKAQAHYRKAFELQPRDGLKEKMRKTRDETLVEKNLSSYHERNFLIKYREEERQFEGFELRELLRETYRDISREFGYYFDHKIVVLLYDLEEFRQLTGQPHWAAAVYDGKIRMPAYQRGFSLHDLRVLTTHEMTHAFVAAMSRGRAPIWLHEGLAKYQEDKVRKASLKFFNVAASNNRLIPMDELLAQGPFTGAHDLNRINLFYEQSFHLVRYLVGRYGMFGIKQLLAAFGQGKNPDEAIRAALKVSPMRLESEWKSSFTKR